MTPIISARGLSKRYGRTLAVDNIDLEIPPGRILGLIGDLLGSPGPGTKNRG